MIRWRLEQPPLERIAAADLEVPLLSVAAENDTLYITPVDADAALRLPARLVAPAIERCSLKISNAVERPMTAAERRSVPALARRPAGNAVRSFDWPISFREADQPVPMVLRGFAARVAAMPRWSVAGLAQEQRLAASSALDKPELTRFEREALTASLHWSM